VELLDVYPTLVELCNLPQPRQQLEGKSLVPLLEEPDSEWGRPAYSVVQRGTDQARRQPIVMGRTVRTERWRYTEWDDGKAGRELYDHDNDPREFTNLAREAAHAESLAEMKRLLESVRK
jgi:uncharacterized sulfatase